MVAMTEEIKENGGPALSSGDLELPSVPNSSCFRKEDFMKADFQVDEFIGTCRRRVGLEATRSELLLYLKVLRSAMIELINKDYADFVNLSTNLVGMDGAITNIEDPLAHLESDIDGRLAELVSAVQHMEQKLEEKRRVRQEKAELERLMSIAHSVHNIERLMKLDKRLPTDEPVQLSGQLLERVGSEFNKLQFNVTKSKGAALVEVIKPRISDITSALQQSLEALFLKTYRQADLASLRQCLRTYATIDKTTDAEQLFRQHVVQPELDELVAAQPHSPASMSRLYTNLLEATPRLCESLRQAALPPAHSQEEAVRGFDFPVNAIFPEFVDVLESRCAAIFAPGDPDLFFEHYTAALDFLHKFELLCASQASVKRLRAHPAYGSYLNKWSLPVYFQIRFQDIGGSLEEAFAGSVDEPGEGALHLRASVALLSQLRRCWSPVVYVPALAHRFTKLYLQLTARYCVWGGGVLQQAAQSQTAEAGMPRVSSAASLKQEGRSSQEGSREASPSTKPTAVSLLSLAKLAADAHHLAHEVEAIFGELAAPRLKDLGFEGNKLIKDSVQEASDSLRNLAPRAEGLISERLAAEAGLQLRQAADVPRLYRKTNRDKPSCASNYVSASLRPLTHFLQQEEGVLTPAARHRLTDDVLRRLIASFHSITQDVLTAVRKMEESLKRLKKSRAPALTSASGLSDDDKIRLQLLEDVRGLGAAAGTLGEVEQREDYQQLLALVTDSMASGAG